ncbi:MAG: single-stranded-DNA-specific exonuclease RecJ [Planctomycetota bacterium]|nr:single-stranded-DNA-specific exonuclease RecJ [Planctomycetota bacterium]
MLKARAPWRRRSAPEDLIAELEHELHLAPLTARLLVQRGITNPVEAERFLSKRLSDLHKPELLRDMDVAAKRFAHAIEQRQRIMVHGDFDVDGSTSTALLKLFCKLCSHDVTAWIPHRIDDGYGLTEASFEAAREHQAELMITVDCGISDHGWAQRIEQELGCDVIVTDHHLSQGELPNCTAVCNPNRPDCDYPDKGLAGVGVAWKLCWSTACVLCGSERVTDRMRSFLLDALALVAVGSVADCAPLGGENRILVHHGLQALGRSSNHGLRALIEQCRLGDAITADDIGWKIAPLLNASGRLSSAMRNISLLCADTAEDAAAVLHDVVDENEERKRLSQHLTEDLIAQVETDPQYAERNSLVFAGEGWHAGVVGIVASRLVDRFAKPACVIAIENGVGKGSLRTVAGFHLGEALAACKQHLIKGGGHAAAAGITIEPDQVDAFSAAFEAHVSTTCPGGFEPPSIEHDGTACIGDLDSSFYADLQRIEPFGNSNPEPVLCIDDVRLIRPQLFGRNGDHVRGSVTDAGGGLQPFYHWRGKDSLTDATQPGCTLEFLVRPQLNRWRGELQPRLVFVDGRAR